VLKVLSWIAVGTRVCVCAYPRMVCIDVSICVGAWVSLWWHFTNCFGVCGLKGRFVNNLWQATSWGPRRGSPGQKSVCEVLLLWSPDQPGDD